MVSPLQTWQHSEPRRLWPVLGGLSFLVHVGVLGLSLPYVLELMEPSGDRSAMNATPVELISVDKATQAKVPPTEAPTPAEEQTGEEAPSEPTSDRTLSVSEALPETVTEASPPVSTTADSRSPAISSSQGITTSPSVTSPSVRAPAASDPVQPQVSSTDDPVSVDSSDTVAGQTPVATQADAPLPAQQTDQQVAGEGTDSTPEESLGASTESASQAEDSQFADSSQLDSSQSEESQSSQSEDSPTEASESDARDSASTTSESGSESGVSADNGEPESAGQIENSVSEPPVVEGEQLPAPSTTPGEEAPQVAALQVMTTAINIVQDQKDVPPRLLNASGTIALQPESLGCGQVDFAEGPLTYRLAINADSTLRTVTPFPLDERSSVQAVACLIRSADFQFEAAMSEGVPVLDDSLLITVQVIEAQLE